MCSLHDPDATGVSRCTADTLIVDTGIPINQLLAWGIHSYCCLPALHVAARPHELPCGGGKRTADWPSTVQHGLFGVLGHVYVMTASAVAVLGVVA